MQGLKSQLKKEGKTIKWLAEQLGKEPLTIRNWNSGKTEPDKANREMIAKLLNWDAEGVSTSPRTESGVSDGVSDRNASQSDSSESSMGGTLALRTHDGN